MLCQFERVIFPRDASASTSGFMIAVYKPCGILRDAAGHILDRFKAVGYCLPTSNKIKYKMEGRWSKSPKHGIQFEVERYEEVIMSWGLSSILCPTRTAPREVPIVSTLPQPLCLHLLRSTRRS